MPDFTIWTFIGFLSIIKWNILYLLLWNGHWRVQKAGTSVRLHTINQDETPQGQDSGYGNDVCPSCSHSFTRWSCLVVRGFWTRCWEWTAHSTWPCSRADSTTAWPTTRSFRYGITRDQLGFFFFLILPRCKAFDQTPECLVVFAAAPRIHAGLGPRHPGAGDLLPRLAGSHHPAVEQGTGTTPTKPGMGKQRQRGRGYMWTLSF